MALNIAGMQQNPNIIGNFQQGMAFGQQQRAITEQRAEQEKLRSLAPQIIAGDSSAYEQAAVISPEAANQYQGVANNQAQKFKNWFNYTDQALQTARKTGNLGAVNAALREGAPFVSKMLGKPAPTEWSPDMDSGWEQLRAKVAMIGQNSQGMPAGFQELHMKALAAGLQPGTPEYQQAMNIALGREGRAATGGFGFEKVVGADGRERMGRTNPRTGVFEVYDEGSGNFIPLGGPAALNGGQIAPQAQSYGAPAQEVGRADMERDIALANEMVAAGIPSQQVDAFLQSRGARASGQQPQQTNPALGVSQSPAERKFAEESGQQAAQIATLRERGQIEAQNEADKAAAKAVAENAADRSKASTTKAPQLQNVERGLDRIEAALSALESGRFGDTGPVDQYYQRFTPQGQELDAAVGAIQNDMLALTRVPGVGSQSDLEAKIANLKYPALSNDPAVNRRNVQQLRAFMRDMAESLGRAPRADAPSGWSIQRIP